MEEAFLQRLPQPAGLHHQPCVPAPAPMRRSCAPAPAAHHQQLACAHLPPHHHTTTLQTIAEEEASFSRTLIKGIERFKKAAAASTDGKISGPDAFLLWDTFGFPVDLTQLMAEEAGLAVDMQGAWSSGRRLAVWHSCCST